MFSIFFSIDPTSLTHVYTLEIAPLEGSQIEVLLRVSLIYSRC